MVNELVNVRDKHRGLKKTLKIFLIVFVVLFLLIIVFAAGYLLKKPTYVEVFIENPLINIVEANTNIEGEVDVPAVIEQAVIEFDEDYINYLLAALGTGYLHKSLVGGDPFLELVMNDGSENEIWHAEVIEGMPNSALGEIDNEDLRITISKEEAVKAILSEDIGQFMKDSYSQGNLGIEMVANKAELFAKGYLEMYKMLTGEEVPVE
jgi:hypothetical protein